MDDEREQIDQLRTWWSDYGNYVLAGVVIGAAGLFGANWYQSNRLDAGLEASNAFSALADAVDAGELDTAEALAGELTTNHPKSAYAAQARLAIARLYMDRNRDEDAATALTEVLDSTAAEGYREVARLRLARIRLYQDRPNDVLELLGEPAATPAEDAFAARYDEVRGDAYVALGRLDDAREAYRRALSEPARDATINQELVQLKLLDLPVEAVPAANEPAGVANEPAPGTGDVAGEPAAPAADPASEGAAPPDPADTAGPAAESEEPADDADEADE